MAHFKIVIGFVCSGIFWLLVFYVFRVIFGRKKRSEKPRQIQFTLPDRENAFVRSRLKTVLNRAFCEAEREEERLAVEFSQALKTVEKLSLAKLSPAEQLEIYQMQSALKAFKRKEKFTAKEVSSINETFARLLKLSAKHEI